MRPGWIVPVLLAAAFSSASEVAAQRVHGRVTDEANRLPVAGAFITLVDLSGKDVQSALTDGAGMFHLQAPAAGRYVLRIERMGHRTRTSDTLSVAEDQVLIREFAVAVDPVRLEGISASGVGRCDLPRELGAATHGLWDEVRKALAVARWIEQQPGMVYQASFFARARDLVSLEIEAQETRLQSGYG